MVLNGFIDILILFCGEYHCQIKENVATEKIDINFIALITLLDSSLLGILNCCVTYLCCNKNFPIKNAKKLFS